MRNQGMKTSIATGNFGSSKVFMKVGIAQILNNFNIQSNISHKRRIHTPTEKTGKLATLKSVSDSDDLMIINKTRTSFHENHFIKSSSRNLTLPFDNFFLGKKSFRS